MRRRKVDPFIANKSELQASAHKYHSLSEVLFYCSWWKLLHLFISSEEIRLRKPQLLHSTHGLCRSAFSLKFKEFWFLHPHITIIMFSINRTRYTKHSSLFATCLTCASCLFPIHHFLFFSFTLFFVFNNKLLGLHVLQSKQFPFINDNANYFALSL